MKKTLVSISLAVFVASTAYAGKTLFKDSFQGETLDKAWDVQVTNASLATWTVEKGILKGKAYLKRSGVAVVQNPEWSNYEFTAEFKYDKASKNMNAGFLFHFSPPKGRHKIYWTGFLFTVLPNKVKVQMVDPVWRKLKNVDLKSKIDVDAWHKIKITVIDEEIKCYLDGKLVIDELSGKLPKGGIGLRVVQGAVTLFKNIELKELSAE